MIRAAIFSVIIASSLAAKASRDELPEYPVTFVPSSAPLVAKPIGESNVKDHFMKTFRVSRLSRGGSGDLFSWLRLSNLPFLYPKDCCHSRAYLMAGWMADRSIKAAEIFVRGNLLYHSPVYGNVAWAFHVAPAVLDDRGHWVILDPSTQTAPVSLQAWLNTFVTDRNYKITVTSRAVYGDRNLYTPSPADDRGYYSNIAQGELMGCAAAENRHP